jgi:hypothetical protein
MHGAAIMIKKWYFKFFKTLLNVAVHNAFMMYSVETKYTIGPTTWIQ